MLTADGISHQPSCDRLVGQDLGMGLPLRNKDGDGKPRGGNVAWVREKQGENQE